MRAERKTDNQSSVTANFPSKLSRERQNRGGKFRRNFRCKEANRLVFLLRKGSEQKNPWIFIWNGSRSLFVYGLCIPLKLASNFVFFLMLILVRVFFAVQEVSNKNSVVLAYSFERMHILNAPNEKKNFALLANIYHLLTALVCNSFILTYPLDRPIYRENY